VKRYLPPDNDQTRRMKKYRDMFDAFEKMDGQLRKVVFRITKNIFILCIQIFSFSKGLNKEPTDRLKRTGDAQKPQHNPREQPKSVFKELLIYNITILYFSLIQNLQQINLEHLLDSIEKRQRLVSLMNQNLLQKSRIFLLAKSKITKNFSTCIFCGEKNEDFIRDGLETHYWANCPMLRRCQECNQVCLFFCPFIFYSFV